MGKIIKFPNQNDKVKDVKKGSPSNSYQGLAILGLGSIFLFALILNISFQNKEEKTRDLANFSDVDDSSNLNEYILKSLNSSEGKMEIVYSRKPSSEDKLVFEILLGSYDILKTDGRISSITLKPGYKALKKTALPNVLSQYRKALGIDQLDYKLVSEDVHKQNLKYDLISQGAVIGDMSISLNADYQILSIDSHFK